jgi:biotin transport system substrate-specific component
LLAGGRGGLGVFMGPTAGFLLGWVPAAAVTGWLFERCWQRLNFVYALAFIFLGGVVVIYACGIAWLATVSGVGARAAAISLAMFLPGDLIKVVATTAVALTVRRSYPLIAAARA